MTRVTDAGLKHLAGMKRLDCLELAKTRVTDAGLKHLAEAPELRALVLSGTDVTDAGSRASAPPAPSGTSSGDRPLLDRHRLSTRGVHSAVADPVEHAAHGDRVPGP
jgi:hypothetical protein